MICISKIKYLLFFMITVIFLPFDSFAGQVAWNDYKTSLTESIKVCNTASQRINVNLPSAFLKTKSGYVVLAVDIKHIKTKKIKHFKYIQPFLHFNEMRYQIPMIRNFDTQTYEVKIDTKHLKVGNNIIKASVSWQHDVYTTSFCGFKIIKMSFVSQLPLSHEVATSSNLTETGSDKAESPFFRETILLRSKTAEKNKDAIAVVIGNQIYRSKDIPPVNYATNDVSAIKKYLIETLGYKDGNIIQNLNASKADLEMIFGTERNHKGMLYNYIKPQKSDVFIYYSGHGSPDPNTNKAYLVPTDCNPVMMDLTAYPLEILYGNLPKIEAKSVTVVIDACFSGGTNTGKWLVPNASPALLKVNNPVTTQNNLTILTSAENTQVSSWYPEKEHSLFTYFFLKAVMGEADINQNKQITFQEIYNFVGDRTEGVPYYAKRLHGGRTQTPTMHAARNDAVFVEF